MLLVYISLFDLMKSMENDIEYNMNRSKYGFVKICKTNTSCNSITKYQKYQNTNIAYSKSHSIMLKHLNLQTKDEYILHREISISSNNCHRMDDSNKDNFKILQITMASIMIYMVTLK